MRYLFPYSEKQRVKESFCKDKNREPDHPRGIFSLIPQNNVRKEFFCKGEQSEPDNPQWGILCLIFENRHVKEFLCEDKNREPDDPRGYFFLFISQDNMREEDRFCVKSEEGKTKERKKKR